MLVLTVMGGPVRPSVVFLQRSIVLLELVLVVAASPRLLEELAAAAPKVVVL